MKQNGFYVKKFFNIKRQAMLAVKFGKNGKLVEKAFQLFKQVAIKTWQHKKELRMRLFLLASKNILKKARMTANQKFLKSIDKKEG